MAPQAKRIDGPTAIRHLLTATSLYQRTVTDVVATIQDAISEGTIPTESEIAYARLLLSLTRVQEALMWTAERSRILLGEAEEGETRGSVT